MVQRHVEGERKEPVAKVSLRVGMPPEAFRRLQDDFVRDLAKLLRVDPAEIEVLDVQLVGDSENILSDEPT